MHIDISCIDVRPELCMEMKKSDINVSVEVSFCQGVCVRLCVYVSWHFCLFIPCYSPRNVGPQKHLLALFLL